MNHSSLHLPCSVSLNAFKAYFDDPNLSQSSKKSSNLNAFDLEWDIGHPKALRLLALDKIIENWPEYPIYNQIPLQEDKNYILDHLSLNLPLDIVSANIRDDFFWKKSYYHRWKVLPTLPKGKAWISVYMERHLQEYIEKMETSEYDRECIQTTMAVCAEFVNSLTINYLQPSKDEACDHIPLDLILSSLPDLKALRLTYCAKTVGKNFLLNCSTLSRHDTWFFSCGLIHCEELLDFCLHSTKLQPQQLTLISKSLEKGCNQLTSISFSRCRMGDLGLRNFLNSCSKDSFRALKYLNLEDNRISAEGAFNLSQALYGRTIETLNISMNPIQSDGAVAIFSILQSIPLTWLDMSGCRLNETLSSQFAQLIRENETIEELNVSNNNFGEEFEIKMSEAMELNKTLCHFDLRNTGVSHLFRMKVNRILNENNKKNNSEKLGRHVRQIDTE